MPRLSKLHRRPIIVLATGVLCLATLPGCLDLSSAFESALEAEIAEKLVSDPLRRLAAIQAAALSLCDHTEAEIFNLEGTDCVFGQSFFCALGEEVRSHSGYQPIGFTSTEKASHDDRVEIAPPLDEEVWEALCVAWKVIFPGEVRAPDYTMSVAVYLANSDRPGDDLIKLTLTTRYDDEHSSSIRVSFTSVTWVPADSVVVKPSKCPECGNDLRASRRTCPECGSAIGPKRHETVRR